MFGDINYTFLFVSALLVACSLMSVTRSSMIYSLVFLILVFISASLLLLLLESEFLALLFVTIYVGAISTLFLFSVMFLDFKMLEQRRNVMKYVPLSLTIGFVLLAPLICEINNFFPTIPKNSLYVDNYFDWYDLIDSTTDIEAIGLVLYSHFILHILVVGLILLSVLFGVVHLMNNTNKNSNKQQILFKQLSKTPSSRFSYKKFSKILKINDTKYG
jgi:NADH-quinone oxidoreductase subunit J